MKGILFVTLLLFAQNCDLSYCFGDYGDLFETESPSSSDNILVTSPPATTKSPERVRTTTDSALFEICEHDEQCATYFLCNKGGKISSESSLIIDDAADNLSGNDPLICPPHQKCCKITETLPPVAPGEVCDDFFSLPNKCGFRNPKGLGGVVNSLQNRTLYAQYAEFPWMMAVMIERPTKKGTVLPYYQCGGSLIHPKVVLTTAHNVASIDPKKLIVRGGEWDTQSNREMCDHVERKVQKVIKHEKFTRSDLHNDIALLVLKEEFELTSFINTICLPPKESNFDNQRCLVSGWGKNKFGKAGVRQVFLKKVELPIVPQSKCQEIVKKTELGDDFELFDGFLCAGGEKNKDACTGDGGSPLVCEVPANPEHYYQTGIVVGGLGCGEKGVPAFYIDVAKYRKWIDDQFSKLDLDKNSYRF